MRTTTAGLSILAGGLVFAGSAAATDIIVNGSFEDGPGVGWIGDFGTYNYTAAYYAGPPVPASENPGSLYSWKQSLPGGDYSGPLLQTNSLAAGASDADIDAGRGVYTFSAWLASYTQNPEAPLVTLQFLDALNQPMGSQVGLDRTSALNFTRFADGVTTFDRTTHEHYWAKYIKNGSIPPGARSAVVGVTRSPNAGLSNNPDTYTDLVKLDIDTAAFVAPSVVSSSPSGPATRPDAVVTVVLLDGTSQIDPAQVQLTFDGAPVTPNVSRQGPNTTITYDPPGLLPAESSHSVRMIAADNAPVTTRLTNEFSFTVASYYNLLLPTPIYLQDFESTAEGSLPPGWTGVSLGLVPDPNLDLSDLDSASYTNFTVVDSARFNSPLKSYLTHDLTSDYQRVLTPNYSFVINGAVVEHLAQNKICFGDSGYRDGGSQILYLFTPDFDLRGKPNVYLVFNSLWEQNQDSIGAVEYSIDEGATWLPIIYYLDRNDLINDASGNLDPVATLSTPHGDVATYTDGGGNPQGGFYGAFIGVDSGRWSELGPYLSGRVDDDPLESKRVEVFRLPAADNQAKVRLRFAHAGTDSWYFGLDNIGLYSITVLNPPLIHGPTPGTFTEAVGNSANFHVDLTGVGPFTYQWNHNGTPLGGQTNASLGLASLNESDSGNYTVTIGYVGGNVVSGPAALTVFTPPSSAIVGQWDFDSLDLRATVGRDLEYWDTGVEFNTGFLDSDFFLLPNLDGKAVNVMQFPGLIGGTASGGYKMFHRMAANGGGTNVNQYTLIMDIIYPAASSTSRRTLLQTDPNNLTDGSFRVETNNAVGVSGVYDGMLAPDAWNRLALAVDLVGPGPHPIVAKFINGRKVGQQVLSEGRDGRWSLSANPNTPYALILGDNDVDAQVGYVNSIQLRSGRMSDASIIAMGGPSSTKIPGAVSARFESGHPVIHWSGATLENAPSPSGPWSTVGGAAKPYPVPGPLGELKFYRSR